MTAWRTAAKPLPPAIQRVARDRLVRIRHRGLRESDVILASYPKSGSTWLRFMLAQALTSNEADFDSIRDLVPPIGRHRRAPSLLSDNGRLVRTHERLEPFLGRPARRVVSLLRDGRDVALSYLAHERRYERFSDDVATFVETFLDGRVDSYGPWHEHVLSALALERSTDVSVLRVHYESVRADPATEVDRILAFVGVSESERDGIDYDALVAANSKDAMRDKEARSEFLARMTTDGSPLVRPDDAESWDEVVPVDVRRRFDEVCGPAMRAAGYEP